MNDEELKRKILEITNEEEVTFLELFRELTLDMQKKANWKKLKLILMDLEDTGMIEERHFEDGRVEYAIEQKGIDFLNKLKTEK